MPPPPSPRKGAGKTESDKQRSKDQYNEAQELEGLSKVFAKLNHGPITLGRKWLKNLFRLVVCFVTVGVALGGSNNFSNFVALIGSFCCVPLAFIYPCV